MSNRSQGWPGGADVRIVAVMTDEIIPGIGITATLVYVAAVGLLVLGVLLVVAHRRRHH